ncbi:MAG: class I SAM-dependent methyltransferase [Gammaproteobacteria bacterium]|nr:class I SAM-dependent methyltransferase [Gammaproteobacteria bacterium]
MKAIIDKLPLVGSLRRSLRKSQRKTTRPFDSSGNYWEQRYEAGGNSGDGSYDLLAQFKAELLNEFVAEHQVKSLIEYGCGDGNQLKLARYPSYLGFDVSATAVDLCRNQFESDGTKSFYHMNEYAGQQAELTLSLDVVYHLVEDEVFDDYMKRLFDSASRFVIVYASNTDENPDPRPPHVRHRHFTRWVDQFQPDWQLLKHVPNRHPYSAATRTGSFADFYLFSKR